MRIVAALVCLSVYGCGAVQCRQVAIDIYPLPSKPKPAGKVVLKCDGKVLTEINANEAVQ